MPLLVAASSQFREKASDWLGLTSALVFGRVVQSWGGDTVLWFLPDVEEDVERDRQRGSSPTVVWLAQFPNSSGGETGKKSAEVA